MVHIISTVHTAVYTVFAHFWYATVALVVTTLTFVVAVLLPNSSLLAKVLFGSAATFGTKLDLVWSLLRGIETNFTTLSATYTILIASLVGINTAMIVYLMRQRGGTLGQTGATLGVSGAFSGALGVGCAACGSFLLTTILASIGMTGALAILPLHGGELGLISIALLVVTLYVVSNKITAPAVCKP